MAIWSKGMSVFDKIDKIEIGKTRIRSFDAASVEHIGIIESHDESDMDWVNVSGITPEQSGRRKTKDMWCLVTSDVEMV